MKTFALFITKSNVSGGGVGRGGAGAEHTDVTLYEFRAKFSL
jgi:hypothetical protein